MASKASVRSTSCSSETVQSMKAGMKPRKSNLSWLEHGKGGQWSGLLAQILGFWGWFFALGDVGPRFRCLNTMKSSNLVL